MPAITLYAATKPVFNQLLGGLSACIDKAAAHCEAKKIDQSVLVNDRLIADMLPFSKQIQIACDQARGGMARIAGVEVPKVEDTETTLAHLKTRIDSTLAFINSINPSQLAGAEDREIVLQMRAGPTTFKGLAYIQHFVLPNFYFHVTTAYNILRHNGVDIGKRDYLGKY
jgi:uncharacterized protein